MDFREVARIEEEKGFIAYYKKDEWWTIMRAGTRPRFSFYKPSTDKMCRREFKNAGEVINGWAAVEMSDGATFYNPETDFLRPESFASCEEFAFGEWRGVTTKTNGSTLFNVETAQLAQRSFSYLGGFDQDGWAFVKLGKEGWTLYNPETDVLLKFRAKNKLFTWTDVCAQSPEDFEYLPNHYFTDKDGKILKYITNKMTAAMREHQKGLNNFLDIEQYKVFRKKIKVMMEQKIQEVLNEDN